MVSIEQEQPEFQQQLRTIVGGLCLEWETATCSGLRVGRRSELIVKVTKPGEEVPSVILNRWLRGQSQENVDNAARLLTELCRLQNDMYVPGRGSWISACCTIYRDGREPVWEFNYDRQVFAAGGDDFLFTSDPGKNTDKQKPEPADYRQEFYGQNPRSPEHIPTWYTDPAPHRDYGEHSVWNIAANWNYIVPEKLKAIEADPIGYAFIHEAVEKSAASFKQAHDVVDLGYDPYVDSSDWNGPVADLYSVQSYIPSYSSYDRADDAIFDTHTVTPQLIEAFKTYLGTKYVEHLYNQGDKLREVDQYTHVLDYLTVIECNIVFDARADIAMEVHKQRFDLDDNWQPRGNTYTHQMPRRDIHIYTPHAAEPQFDAPWIDGYEWNYPDWFNPARPEQSGPSPRLWARTRPA